MSGDSLPPGQNIAPGDRLRHARQQLGWSVQETAALLHVIPRYVSAIENAQFSQLPGLVFLKGYVRSYARLVELPEDQLIEDLEQELMAKDDPILKQIAASVGPFVEEEETKSKKVLWYLLLLLILAGAGFVAWSNYELFFGDQPSAFLSGESVVEDLPEDTDSGSAELNPPQIEQGPLSDSPDMDVQNIRDPVTGEIKLRLNISDESRAPASNSTPNIESTTSTDPMTQSDNGRSEILSGQGAAELPASSGQTNSDRTTNTIEESARNQGSSNAEIEIESTPVVVTEQAAETVGLISVIASFTGDCWFDLRDRDNERVVGLYRSGDRISFSGQYPLKFIVGAVSAVSITVNNKPLDFSNYLVKNNRAQFTLEQ